MLMNAGAPFQRKPLLKFASWRARDDSHDEEEMRKLISILADGSGVQRSAVGEHQGQKYEGEEDYGEVDTVLPDEQDFAAQARSLVEREL